MKYLYLLGACGSIGTQVLDIVRKNPLDFKVVGMSVGADLVLAKNLILEFKPEIVCFRKKEHTFDIEYHPQTVFGDEGLLAVAKYHHYENEWLVNALVGVAGLEPTIRAIESKKNIALANKETLVVGGDLIQDLIKEYGVELLPIDSEHSAILQCLAGEQMREVKRLIITASGGSFRDKTREELTDVTVEDALKHPNWSMGSKITIDSATMMNKGFEVIEAHYLFNIDYSKIDTVLHPESIVHSLVEFEDGSIKAQLGISDMRIPISYALHFPEHKYQELPTLNLLELSLHFKELSMKRYPCLEYAYLAAEKGGLYLAVLNASNEAAVHLFLNKRIKFLEIESIILEEISKKEYEREAIPSLEERLKVSREVYERIVKEHSKI